MTRTDETTEPAGGSADGVLAFGGLLPQTGDLAFLGPPEEAGVQLAVEDINAAGGVLGADVTFDPGDSGDTNTDIANQTTDRHLANGVDAIIGAASSGVSFTVIDKITGANVIQFSGANTSPDFTTYDDNGLYFRTAPSDVLQGRVLSDLIVADGNATVGIMARQDPYGEGLLQYTAEPLAEAGAEVVNDGGIVYDPAAENFDAEVGEIVAADPDAFVMIGFEESAQILTSLFEAGYTQGDKNIYLVDGNIGNALAENFTDPGILEGIRGTLPSAEVSQEFKDRLLEVDPALEDFSYAPETYDAIIITALAAEVAGDRRSGRGCGRDQRGDPGRHHLHHLRGVPSPRRRRVRTSTTTVRVVPTPSVTPVSPRRRASRSSSTAPTTRIDDSLTEYQFAAIEE